jgi:hypothetical protein
MSKALDSKESDCFSVLAKEFNDLKSQTDAIQKAADQEIAAIQKRADDLNAANKKILEQKEEWFYLIQGKKQQLSTSPADSLAELLIERIDILKRLQLILFKLADCSNLLDHHKFDFLEGFPIPPMDHKSTLAYVEHALVQIKGKFQILTDGESARNKKSVEGKSLPELLHMQPLFAYRNLFAPCAEYLKGLGRTSPKISTWVALPLEDLLFKYPLRIWLRVHYFLEGTFYSAHARYRKATGYAGEMSPWLDELAKGSICLPNPGGSAASAAGGSGSVQKSG